MIGIALCAGGCTGETYIISSAAAFVKESNSYVLERRRSHYKFLFHSAKRAIREDSTCLNTHITYTMNTARKRFKYIGPCSAE